MNSNHIPKENQNVTTSGAWMRQKQEVFGPPQAREEVLAALTKDQETYEAFKKLSTSLQEEFLSFCMGTRGLNITYDPVFKMVFNPEIHPERLEEF